MADISDRFPQARERETVEAVELMRQRLQIHHEFTTRKSNIQPGIPGGIPQLAADELYKTFGAKTLDWSDDRLSSYYHTQAERLERLLEQQVA